MTLFSALTITWQYFPRILSLFRERNFLKGAKDWCGENVQPPRCEFLTGVCLNCALVSESLIMKGTNNI